MDLQAVVWLVGGLILLVLGAEWLVRGAAALAATFGVTPLVIGLTVVAYGTSTPELAVSVQAGWLGHADIALANVIGSNIFNSLFILGICALILPLAVSSQLIRTDVPIMIGASLLAMLLALIDGRLQWWDGVLLTAGIIIYSVWSIRKSRAETRALQEEFAAGNPHGVAPDGQPQRALLLNVLYVVGGLIVLVFGARGLIGGATSLAQMLGISDAIIGLTIVAAGTSLPEVATSIIAALRGRRDIAIGNVVGSNIYNLLAILGISALVTPGGLVVDPAMARLDIPVMLGTALLCLPIFFTGMRIARWEGALFLLAYLAYITYLILGATGSTLQAPFGLGLLIAAPIVANGVIATAAHAWLAQSPASRQSRTRE